jgi:osmoprotectant transport system substrate-binding protein
MYLTARSVKRGCAGGLVLAAGTALAACGSSASSGPLTSAASQDSVVVGSANFPEDQLIAQIYATALAAKGVKVTDQFSIGAREAYYPQIEKGAITIIPEYNGALLTTAVDPSSTAATTAQVDAQLKVKLPASLLILNPSPAQDKDSVTVTQAFAAEHHLSSIAQLKPLAASMVFGAPAEFKTRPDGQAGLRERYGLEFKDFDALDESGPITLKALTDGKVQAADVFTTTPQILTDHLVPLADPKSNFAAQNVVPLVYRKGVTALIANTLNAISARLTTAGLLEMDKAIVVDHANYSTVAAAWLKAEGLPS